MGIWIELEDGETIEKAVRRFRRAILAEGAYPLYHCKYHKRRYDSYLKPSVLRRRRRWLARVKQRIPPVYGPAPNYHWADDLLLKPYRGQGRLGPHPWIW